MYEKLKDNYYKVLFKYRRKIGKSKSDFSSIPPYKELVTLDNDVLMSLARHEAHRIEKSIYNDIFDDKYDYYLEKAYRIDKIVSILDERGAKYDSSISWAMEVRGDFDDIDNQYIQPRIKKSKTYSPEKLDEFLSESKERRSVRVWSDTQPSKEELISIGNKLIDTARWSPNSGNRQAWMFKLIVDDNEKLLLKGVKEEHCYNAPLLIFVGMNKKIYGSLSGKKAETALYIDGGAASMSIVMAAHHSGLGACWNHFGIDLINSRERNKDIYSNFSKNADIPDNIAPVAIIAVGSAQFIPPTPERKSVEELMM